MRLSADPSGEIDEFVEAVPTDHVLYTHLDQRLAEIEIDDSQKASLLREAEQAIRTVVIPAYEALREALSPLTIPTTA